MCISIWSIAPSCLSHLFFVWWCVKRGWQQQHMAHRCIFTRFCPVWFLTFKKIKWVDCQTFDMCIMQIKLCNIHTRQDFAKMQLCAPFNLPDTKDVIALNGGAVADQKHSTFFFRKKDVSGLLSWHGTKVPATSHMKENRKKKVRRYDCRLAWPHFWSAVIHN